MYQEFIKTLASTLTQSPEHFLKGGAQPAKTPQNIPMLGWKFFFAVFFIALFAILIKSVIVKLTYNMVIPKLLQSSRIETDETDETEEECSKVSRFYPIDFVTALLLVLLIGTLFS